MGGRAAYDEIADWYTEEFLAAGDPLDIKGTLRALLGPDSGPCLEIGCGTGIYAEQVRELGWTPMGLDLSAGMLRHAKGRMPIARTDVEHLCVRDSCLPAVVAVMVHTDMPAYPEVLREVERVLVPGGVFVHIGVHPCFCGGFADHSDRAAVVIRPGYLDSHWTKESWTSNGIRDKVGATHWPLPELLQAFLDAGLTLERFAEGGTPTPVMFAIKARKSVSTVRTVLTRDI